MATGRSDYPNQINNVLAFPGVFRGALDVRVSRINEEMKPAAARAIASVVADDELDPEYIIPSVFNREVASAVATAVAEAAQASGVTAPRRRDVRGRRLNERARVVRNPGLVRSDSRWRCGGGRRFRGSCGAGPWTDRVPSGTTTR